MLNFFIYRSCRKLPWMFSCRFINYTNCCAEFSSKNVLKRQLFYGNKQPRWPTKTGSLSNICLYSRLYFQTRGNARTFTQCILYSSQVKTTNYGHTFKNHFSSQKYPCMFSRNFSNSQRHKQKNRTTAIYIIALVTVVLGGSYAAVPLYRIFCQASGLGGTVQQAAASEKIRNMTAKKERLITVKFNADKSATMQWSFKPLQNEVKVYPGETALAFYTAKNPTDNAITGISTYNVIPFEAGQYFNKIQCFCFEEQRLNPHEQVDMPVFFYIDPEFSEDPALYKSDTITLSYTFFQAKEAHDLGI